MCIMWTSTISIWQSSIRYMCAYAVVDWYRALFCSDDMRLNNISVLHVWTAHMHLTEVQQCGAVMQSNYVIKMLSGQDLFSTHFQFLIYNTNMFVCDSHVKNLNLSTQYTVYLHVFSFHFATTLRWFWLHYQDTNTDIWPEQYGFQCHCSSAW